MLKFCGFPYLQGEFNGIPVVNMNLSQSNQVLINSPLAGYDSSIKRHVKLKVTLFSTIHFKYS
jgi:hypothetical protein